MTKHKMFCEYGCGQEAKFKAINSGRWRCAKSINACPGFHKKTKEGQKRYWISQGAEKLRAHMTKMSKLGNNSPKRKTAEYKNRVSEKISKSIQQRGGYIGKNNPNFGNIASTETRKKMRKSAALRDNSNIGKYERTMKHRDVQSKRMINRLQSNKPFKTKDTKPEIEFAQFLDDLNIDYEKQFLIQFGSMENRFRHCYDFLIKDTNILIEIDGDYWHSRPTAKERDKQCEKIADEHGYIVFRIKQSELKSKISFLKGELS